MIEIIPAIDIIDGKCVRLSKGDYAQKKIYNESPCDVARAFEDCGCRCLHVVDLDGARAKHVVNYKALEAIAAKTSLIVDFGGGIKSDDDLRIAFECGARKVTGGSVAQTEPQLFLGWLQRYGGESIILGADCRDGKIAVNGWLNDSDSDVVPFIADYCQKGVTQVISTDISCDGMLQGPSLELYAKIQAAVPQVRLIASGGVSSLDDVYRLNDINVPAVIVGKAIYEGRIAMTALERFNTER